MTIIRWNFWSSIGVITSFDFAKGLVGLFNEECRDNWQQLARRVSTGRLIGGNYVVCADHDL